MIVGSALSGAVALACIPSYYLTTEFTSRRYYFVK
jgi:hypothetical protein